MKKYIAYLTGYDTLESGSTTKQLKVDSFEEAKKWCNDNSYMGGYDWHVDFLVNNPNYKEETK